MQTVQLTPDALLSWGGSIKRNTRISPALRKTFLIHFLLGAVTGVLLIWSPGLWVYLGIFPFEEPVIYRLGGAVVLGFTMSSWFALKDGMSNTVKNVVRMEIVSGWLVTGVMVWALVNYELPQTSWICAAITGVFAFAFTVFSPR